MRVSFKTIYSCIYQKFIVKGNIHKLRRKGKSLKHKETSVKFNIGKSIKDRPKDIRKREIIAHWSLDTVAYSRRESLIFNKHCFKVFKEIPSNS